MSLLVVPSPTLVFTGDEASLSLHNLTAAAMAFRVVPSAADALEIAPASGVLAAAQSVRVALRRTTASGVPHALYVRTIPAPADGASAADAWAAAGDRVEEHALTCDITSAGRIVAGGCLWESRNHGISRPISPFGIRLEKLGLRTARLRSKV